MNVSYTLVQLARHLIWCGSPRGWNYVLKWREVSTQPLRWRATVRGLLYILPSTSFALMLLGVGMWNLARPTFAGELGFGLGMLIVGGLWLLLNALRALSSTEVEYTPSSDELAIHRRVAGLRVLSTANTLEEMKLGFAQVRFLGLVSGRPVEATILEWPNGETAMLTAGGSSAKRYSLMPFADRLTGTAHGTLIRSKYIVL